MLQHLQDRPSCQLLAWENGDRLLEYLRHSEFELDRIKGRRERELFRPSPELVEHINSLQRATPMKSRLTIADLRQRPTITVREYADFVGVSVDAVYEAAARGELKVLRLGRRVLLPTAPLLRDLGIDEPADIEVSG
jgi:excisionase family DNA binding protein